MEVEHAVPQGMKPSRSDGGGSLTAEEEAKRAQAVQEFLKATTPVRPLKPCRSEDLDDGALKDLAVPADSYKAELERFQALQVDGKLMHMDGGSVNDDSYVETQYYDDLNAVDKNLHHQTGTGFIAGEPSGVPFSVGDDGERVFRTSTKSNPATNEWQPSPPEYLPAESRVHRSDP